MPNPLLVVRNPKAGSFISQNQFLEAASVIFKDDRFSTYVYTTTKRGDGTRFVMQEGGTAERIVAFGGDGTLNEVINGIMHLDKRPLLGYIPAGTTNDFASGVGLSRSVVKAAETVVDGVPSPLDVGQFGEDRYFSYVASFGTFTKASYSAPQDVKNVLGYAAYLLEGLKSLSDVRSYHMTVTANGETFEDDFIFGAVSNAMSVGGVMKFSADQVDLSDGLFEVLMIRSPRNLADLQQLLVDVSARHYESCQHILYMKSADVVVRCGQPVAWTVDGESGGEWQEIRLRNCHHAIQILKPKESEHA